MMTEDEIRALRRLSRTGGGEAEIAVLVDLAGVLLPVLADLGSLPLGTTPPATVFRTDESGTTVSRAERASS